MKLVPRHSRASSLQPSLAVQHNRSGRRLLCGGQRNAAYQSLAIGQYIELAEVDGVSREQRRRLAEAKGCAGDCRNAHVLKVVHRLIEELFAIAAPPWGNASANGDSLSFATSSGHHIDTKTVGLHLDKRDPL